MPKPRRVKFAVVGVLLLLLLSSSDALAVTLPNPPDRSAPANNQSGSLASNGQSFTGGVFLVKDGSSDQNVSTNEFVAQFFCATSSANVAKQYPSEIGESITGPISKEQASGIAEAMNSVRPPSTVSLPLSITGVYGGNLTYWLTGITYNVTTYSVWTTTQQSPAAEQRVGYIVVSVPTRPQLGRTFQDLAGAFCPSIGYMKVGSGFGPGSWSWLKPLARLSTPPGDGFWPIITYGTVRVLSSAGMAAAAHIRPGENATFVLPPGTYSAVSDVALFGVPFSVGSGTYSSPEGATTTQFAVSLASVESIWYALEASALVVLVAVLLLLARRLHVWATLVRGFARGRHLLHSGWDAMLRASREATEPVRVRRGLGARWDEPIAPSRQTL